ncbi:MAG: class I SAM-dependent methyltransferase [Spirochaetaceae bacterium]|nr:MAG: class I SAM-dependent methyltransferase [Spirochaetaceae bacterium]
MPKPSHESSITRRSDKNEAWNQRYLEGRANWSAGPSRVVVETESALDTTGNGAALDLACGSGRNALYLARRGWAVTGVDFAEEALRIARERARREGLAITWLQQNLERWIPGEDAFDFVLICYLHLPWPSFRAILEKAERAIRPGGTLLVLGHDRINITEGTGKPKYGNVAYTPEEVAGALERCTVVRAERDRYAPDHGNSHADQIDCIVQAFKPSRGTLQ